LKLIQIREAEDEAKHEFHNADQNLPYAIQNIDSSIILC
jgi:hypothetical protein